ncbi:MAG: PD-(D/E)XK nuclease family protein [Vicinamibacterales bacterium]
MSAPLRRSAFEAFACPFLYRAKYEEGYEDSSPPAQRGTAFHACAAEYIRLLYAAEQDSDPVLAQQALETGLAERPLAYDLILDIEKHLWPRFVEKFRLNREAFVLAEERQGDGTVTWQPDLVYAYEHPSVLKVVDWKTFFVGLTEVEASEAFQTDFYLWQAMHVWPGFERYEMTYVFPRLGYAITVAKTPQELERFGDRVQSLIAQIQQARATNYWPAVPGDHCKYCTLACPIADDPRRMPLRVVTREDAEAALLKAVALQRQFDQLKEALRGFAEMHGTVSVNGVAAQHKETLSRRFNLVDVLDVLATHDITDLSTLPKMEVSATTLRPLLETKKRAAIGAALLEKAVVKHGERFEISKPVDPGLIPQEEEQAVSA